MSPEVLHSWAEDAQKEIQALRDAASNALKLARNGRYTAAELMDTAKAFDDLEYLLANNQAQPPKVG
jgi:ElaB/YqjD/DUF883 family membrane-anchored ribosome-binding protein